MSDFSYLPMFLKRSSLHYAASASIPIILSLLSIPASVAQQVTTPASVSNPPPITQFPTISSFKPNTNTSCPVSTFSVTGFAGRGNSNTRGNSNANADTIVTFGLSDANVQNYGVAAGITIPIGGGTTLCKELTKQQVLYETSRTQTAILQSQLTLLKQCEDLVKSGFDEESLAGTGNNFSALKVCSKVVFKGKDPLKNDPAKIKPLSPAVESPSLLQIQSLP